MSPIPEIILGPPGTGKTTALLAEVDRELKSGTLPDRIGYVSFTRRAAEEAVTRASATFNLSPRQLPHFRTLHSLCFRALGLSSSDVFAGPRIREFADWAGIRVNGRWSEDGTLEGFAPGDRALHAEHLARARCTPLREQYDADDDELPWREVERVAAALREFKRARGLLDFSDMLGELLRSSDAVPRLDVLVVDEVQDLSRLQWRVVWALCARARRLVVAGDDDQILFRWAGADVDTFVGLPGTVRSLGQSWRVPAAVQHLAKAIIDVIPPGRRRAKEWAPRSETGAVVRAVHLDDADMAGGWEKFEIQPILVLARNTFVLREHVVPALRRAGVLHEWGDRRSLDPETAQAIVAWEHLRAGNSVTALQARGIFRFVTPGRGVDRNHRDLPGVPDEEHVTMDVLTKSHGLRTTAIWHEALDRLPVEDVAHVVAARQRGEHLLGRPRVRLSTIHAAKGGEARHVILFREMARRTHDEMLRSAEGEEDERRCWYVAVTRAKERLTVVEPTRREACPWV